jgi:hypothetical protein
MATKMADVTLHIDEDTTHEERESFRDSLLSTKGVMSADYRDEKPHLMIVGYDPDNVVPQAFVTAAQRRGYHAELIGF